MGFYNRHIGDRLGVPRRKTALWIRLRQNLLLKVISLAVSILLYFYVQSERYPTVTRNFQSAVFERKNAPSGVAIVMDLTQRSIAVTGPAPIVDRLKDGDIHGTADLHSIPTDKLSTALVRLTLSVPSLPADQVQELSFDPPSPSVRVEVFPELTRRMTVVPLYPHEPSFGYRYGMPEMKPPHVKVKGRADVVNRVARVVVKGEPSTLGDSIDGDFPVSAWDADNHPVDGVTIEPDNVHLTVPLVEDSPAKFVLVSPSIQEYPLPPYTLVSYTVTPREVKIIGRPEKIGPISTLPTEDLPVRDLTVSQDIEANLIVPADVTVLDLDGHPVSHVTIHVTIRKAATAPITPPGTINPPPSVNPKP